jgi:hypothetical protein
VRSFGGKPGTVRQFPLRCFLGGPWLHMEEKQGAGVHFIGLMRGMGDGAQGVV